MKLNTPSISDTTLANKSLLLSACEISPTFIPKYHEWQSVSTTCIPTGQIKPNIAFLHTALKPNIAFPHTGQRPAQSNFSQRAAKNLYNDCTWTTQTGTLENTPLHALPYFIWLTSPPSSWNRPIKMPKLTRCGPSGY